MLTVFETCLLDMKKANISHEGEIVLLPQWEVLKMPGETWGAPGACAGPTP